MFKWESKDLFLFTVIQHDWLKSPDKMEVEKSLQKISQKHRFDKSLMASLFSSGKFSTCYLLIIYEMLKRSKKRRSQKHRSEKVFYLFSDDVVIVW